MTGRNKVVSARIVKARVQVTLRASDHDVALNTERNRLITMIEGMQSSNTLLEFVIDSLRAKLRQDEGQPFNTFGVQVPVRAVSHPQSVQPQPAHVTNGEHHQPATQQSANVGAGDEGRGRTDHWDEVQEPRSSKVELLDAGQREEPESNGGIVEQAALTQSQPAPPPRRERRPMGGNALSAM